MKHLDATIFVAGPDRALREASLIAMRVRKTPEHAAELDSLVGDDWRRWLAFGRRNLIGPLVARTLTETRGADHPDAHEWASEYDETQGYVDTLMAELDIIAERLAAEDIRLVALKNAGIARALHPFRGECPMGDIDLLVRRDRLVDAHHVMIELGYEHATRAPLVEPADLDHALESGGAEYRAERGGHEIWVEVQWRPIAGRWIPRAVEPRGEELLERSVAIEGSHARLLEPTDNLLQVALHTAKHTYCRAPGLRLHTDVDRLVAYSPPDWERFVCAARDLRLTTAIYFSLALAGALLDTPVPEDVLDELTPDEAKRFVIARWLSRADIFEPDEKKFNRAGMALFHALLFDKATGAVAAALGTDPDSLTLWSAPHHLRAGAGRALNLLMRYER